MIILPQIAKCVNCIYNITQTTCAQVTQESQPMPTNKDILWVKTDGELVGFKDIAHFYH